MKRRRLINITLLILGVLFIIKITLYKVCTNLDKGSTNHSTSIEQSLSNEFLIDIYSLKAIDDISKNQMKVWKLNSLFIESNWNFKCPIIGLNKIPVKVTGNNIVLPLEVSYEGELDPIRFHLINQKDTIVLRGNRTIKTSYYNKTLLEDIRDFKLVITDESKGLNFIYTLEPGEKVFE